MRSMLSMEDLYMHLRLLKGKSNNKMYSPQLKKDIDTARRGMYNYYLEEVKRRKNLKLF